ncbi:hypothetical protein [[Ruminococcus] lactaris]|uniref:hypothetical protein n=1 Tax=[Ruminococcus] lactaris TaxID=46228 RepID=UPI0004153BC1|nr:hypothetical protein [[Ruminococcus] lactaris]
MSACINAVKCICGIAECGRHTGGSNHWIRTVTRAVRKGRRTVSRERTDTSRRTVSRERTDTSRRTVSWERTDTSRRTVSWERTDTSRRTDG